MIGLFQGMFEKNTLTFNPGWDGEAQPLESFTDIRDLQRQLKAGGMEFVAEVDEAGSGPGSFIVVDPDGNPILSTSTSDRAPAHRGGVKLRRMPAALVTARAVLRLPALRRLIPAFLAFSVAEWASWIALVVYAYSRGGPVEAGIVAGVVFLPSVMVAPAASMFGDRRPRAQVLAGAYAILTLAMAARGRPGGRAVAGRLRDGDARGDKHHARPAGARRAPAGGGGDARVAGRGERRVRDRRGPRALLGPLLAGLLSASAVRRRCTRLWRC